MQKLEIDKDKVLEAMRGFNAEDSERASDAGESRQRIGAFLEETSINPKVFSHCRMALRMKKDDKRQDWLRSMKAILPLMEEQIAAEGTRDAFDAPAAAKEAAQAAPNDDLPEDEESTRLDADPEIAAHLSEVLWQQGKQDQANVLLNEALRNHPDNELLKITRSKLKP